MVDLSIVIVSWNVKNLLRECLESLYKYTSGIKFEVFVVDNNSSDGSAEMVKELFPQVHLIENKQNLGFSKANNQAIIISKGRYIALLNPDTLLIEDVFSPLVKYADQHNEIGAIGPKILDRGGNFQYSCARKLPNLYFDFCRFSGLARKFPKTKIFGSEKMLCVDHNSSRYVEALSGSCMIVRKEAIDDVGMMDENQFMYADEIEWCKRLFDAGWKIYYYANTSIIHYGGESSKQSGIFITIETAKSHYYYYEKHKGKIYALAYSTLLLFFSLFKYVRTLLYRSKKNEAKRLRETHKMNFKWALQKFFCK